ncbi:hypothetical protein FB451DRAFT_558536 [Mycena latifolia]|nr:hypothetical protein FB451DRAFT_558536 [Mycena latifolia]
MQYGTDLFTNKATKSAECWIFYQDDAPGFAVMNAEGTQTLGHVTEQLAVKTAQLAASTAQLAQTTLQLEAATARLAEGVAEQDARDAERAQIQLGYELASRTTLALEALVHAALSNSRKSQLRSHDMFTCKSVTHAIWSIVHGEQLQQFRTCGGFDFSERQGSPKLKGTTGPLRRERSPKPPRISPGMRSTPPIALFSRSWIGGKGRLATTGIPRRTAVLSAAPSSTSTHRPWGCHPAFAVSSWSKTTLSPGNSCPCFLSTPAFS